MPLHFPLAHSSMLQARALLNATPFTTWPGQNPFRIPASGTPYPLSQKNLFFFFSFSLFIYFFFLFVVVTVVCLLLLFLAGWLFSTRLNSIESVGNL